MDAKRYHRVPKEELGGGDDHPIVRDLTASSSGATNGSVGGGLVDVQMDLVTNGTTATTTQHQTVIEGHVEEALDDHREADESSSILLDDAASRSSGNIMFHGHSRKYKDNPSEDDEDPDDEHQDSEEGVTASLSTSMRMNPSSRSSSFCSDHRDGHADITATDDDDDGDDEDDDDWDDDDEAGLRRYHRDFNVSGHGPSSVAAETLAPRKDMPLPAEFSHDSMPKRLWHAFLALRLAARQRRAARLLRMPSESAWNYKLYSCLLTWCCDATDSGIALVAVLMVLWLLIGWTVKPGGRWWWTGMLLFLVRISARSTIESCRSGRSTRRRHRNASYDGVELPVGGP